MAKKFTEKHTEADIKILADELAAIQRYKGIRDLLGHIEIDRLIHFLRKEFYDFNIRELWSAVDLSSAPDNPFNLKYGGQVLDFTNDYFTRILGPYRPYRAAIINRYLQQEMAYDQGAPAEPPPLSEAAMAAILLDGEARMCQTAFENQKAGIPAGGLDRVYDILQKHNMLTFTAERMAEFEVTARERMEKAARGDGRVRTIMQALAKGLPVGTDSLLNETKKVAIQALFSQMKELDASPAELFIEKYSAAAGDPPPNDPTPKKAARKKAAAKAG